MREQIELIEQDKTWLVREKLYRTASATPSKKKDRRSNRPSARPEKIA
jgi:hypothetical protein